MTTKDREWYEWLFKEEKRRFKFKSDQDLLQHYIDETNKAHEHWMDLLHNGCSDPSWPDGCNMNLVKNHVCYYRKAIMALCILRDLPIPKYYYLPPPPEIDNNYMANLNPTDEMQIKRLERLRSSNRNLTSEKPPIGLTVQLNFI